MLDETFEGDLRSPAVWVLRHPDLNRGTALHLRRWGLSAGLTLDRICDVLYAFPPRRLFDYACEEVDFNDEDVMEVFGTDPERQIRAYMALAEKPLRRRLRATLIRRVMFLHFAVVIDSAREPAAAT